MAKKKKKDKKNMGIDNQEMGQEQNSNDMAIEQAINPEATSFIDSDENLNQNEGIENRTPDGKLRDTIINDENGLQKYKKEINYKKHDGQETDEVKAITEKLVDERDDKDRITKLHGQNLDTYKTDHAYNLTTTYDDKKNTVLDSGEVTAGAEMGKKWDKTVSREQVGKYTKETETNAIKTPKKDGKPGEYDKSQTTEVKFISTDDKGKETHVYGWHINEQGEQSMAWGKKPADLNI